MERWFGRTGVNRPYGDEPDQQRQAAADHD